jgi:hypothetical protein
VVFDDDNDPYHTSLTCVLIESSHWNCSCPTKSSQRCHCKSYERQN